MPTRDQVFLGSFGTPPPTIAVSPANSGLGRESVPNPNVAASIAAMRTDPAFYGSLNPSIAKANFIVPTNQGRRAADNQFKTMMYDPRNSPSRSQFSEGYTIPIQVFAASNTWQTPSGQNSKGKRLSQPSTKAVSPFVSAPIPVRMPWDV